METSAVTVREVRPHEYEEAGRITALAYREFARPGEDDWQEYLASLADVAGRVDRTTVLVAVNGPRILGAVTLEIDGVVGDDDDEPEPEAAHVRMLGVDPGSRGRGAGRALMQACIDLARATGKTSVTLRTTDRMLAAHRLYEAMGFHRDPARDLFYEPDFTLIAFRLRLAG